MNLELKCGVFQSCFKIFNFIRSSLEPGAYPGEQQPLPKCLTINIQFEGKIIIKKRHILKILKILYINLYLI